MNEDDIECKAHINRHSIARAVCNAICVVEEGPGNEPARVYDTVVEGAAVELAIYVALRLTRARI